MHVKLPIDKTNRVEVYFSGFDFKIRDLPKLDSLMCSCKSPVLITTSDYVQDINMIKLQRNSRYKVITEIDRNGLTYGGNKIYKIQNLIDADGFEIGLTVGRNSTEILNEMKSITSFLKTSGKQFLIRWSINTNNGPTHIKNCLNAIKNYKDKFDMVSFNTDSLPPELSHNIVKNARIIIGMIKCNMKISGQPSDDLIIHDKNLRYQIEAKYLV